MPSMCSYCAENGLTEAQCMRGDCHDGCGDCRGTAESVGTILAGNVKCRICGRQLAKFELSAGECDRCADEGAMFELGMG